MFRVEQQIWSGSVLSNRGEVRCRLISCKHRTYAVVVSDVIHSHNLAQALSRGSSYGDIRSASIEKRATRSIRHLK
jgi:hypothetical protein